MRRWAKIAGWAKSCSGCTDLRRFARPTAAGCVPLSPAHALRSAPSVVSPADFGAHPGIHCAGPRRACCSAFAAGDALGSSRLHLHSSMQKKRLAALVTEYRPGTHADVLLSKFIHGFACDEPQVHEPRSEIVAMYIDQFPEGEIGREVAQQYGIPIFNSIQAALTLGDPNYYTTSAAGSRSTAHPDPSGGAPARGMMREAPQLAVDGVIIIAEHGDFPWNEDEARIHPRRSFLEQTCAVFATCKHSVPVFNDKHLSPTFEESLWMVERCREVGAPFMAGSSIPLNWRAPMLEHEAGAELEEAVAIGFSGLDIYGAHALDALQAMVERRGPTAAESGVAAVQCLTGDAVWAAGAAGRFSMSLARAACAAVASSKHPLPMEDFAYPEGQPATAFILEYRDGFRATVLMLTNYLGDFGYAATVRGSSRPVCCEMFSQRAPEYGGTGKPAQGPVAHFSYLARNVEEMMVTGVPSYPVERTLLASGVLETALRSRRLGGARLTTPHLNVAYQRVRDLPPYFPMGERPTGATLLPWPPARL